jgi:integrase
MASFRKRAGRWQARIHRHGSTPIVKTFDLKADAERWAVAVQREIDLGSFAPRNEAENTTVSQLIDRYLLEVVPSFKGAERERYALKNIARFLGTYSLAALSPLVVASYRDRRSASVSSGTVLREINSLSALLNHARKEWGIGVTNPVSAIRKPAPSPGRTRRFEGDEEARLMSALEAKGRCSNGRLKAGTRNHWIKPIVELAVQTGMRRGELLALEWRFVDLDRHVAHLPVTKNGTPRDVPLSSAACAVLKELPRSISGRVFPVSMEAFKQAFSRACNAAGLVDFHFHDLRHEAASRLAERLNVLELAAITGHRDLKMLHRYTHLRAQDLAIKIG